MSFKPDFVVLSPDQKLQLVVEVKGIPKSNENWAAQLRRNLLNHDAMPSAPYFLLVLPDHLYLWSHASNNEETILPDFQADTEHVLHRYLTRWNQAGHREPLSGRGLGLAVQSWLNELTSPENPPTSDTSDRDWLKGSGLPERIQTGIVKSESVM